ncbi:hypothetical protein AB0D11_18420 [Streptomyces monashensis]|uniref:hypothetical protein n=1 Tax=Streptomyces monashensis TaxID=1678012 RepID=UPI00340DCC21
MAVPGPCRRRSVTFVSPPPDTTASAPKLREAGLGALVGLGFVGKHRLTRRELRTGC